MDSTLEILHNLQESISNEIRKLESATFRDCLTISLSSEPMFGRCSNMCFACGKECIDDKVVLYSNIRYYSYSTLTNGSYRKREVIFCEKCIDSKANDIFYQPTKSKYNECTLCGKTSDIVKSMYVSRNKDNDKVLCGCCFRGPFELSKPLKNATKLFNKELKKLEINEKKRIEITNSAEVIAQPYIEAGLSKIFAIAIGKGVDPDEVLSLWESEWWKQYPDDDPLLVSVLNGKFTANDARFINDFRSDHDLLASACIQEKITIQWAQALLDCGFNEYPNSVELILKGAAPLIISRLHKIDCDRDAMPPGLSGPAFSASDEENGL